MLAEASALLASISSIVTWNSCDFASILDLYTNTRKREDRARILEAGFAIIWNKVLFNMFFSLNPKIFTLFIVNMAVSSPQAPWHDAPQNAKLPHIQQPWVCNRSLCKISHPANYQQWGKNHNKEELNEIKCHIVILKWRPVLSLAD